MGKSLESRVKAGAALLDDESPGWAERIDPGDLYMRSCHRCVLGQIYGRFGIGLKALGIPDDADTYGFDAAVELTNSVAPEYAYGKELEALGELWVAEVKARRP